MKWKRGSKKGIYNSGVWEIRGKGTLWNLYYDGDLMATRGSKKLCQQVAADDEEPAEEQAPTPTKSLKGLDGVLASLRLDISHLADQISALTAAINKLAVRGQR